MSFARRMETEAATPDKRTEARTNLTDAKSVALNAKSMAFLLAPCISFLQAAGYAVIYGTDYANTPNKPFIVERHRKDAEIRKIVAASIAAGNEFPTRQKMLEQIDTCNERTKAMEGMAAAAGWSMRRIGYAVVLGVVLQVYLTLRLRAHYKKLVGGASAPPQTVTSL